MWGGRLGPVSGPPASPSFDLDPVDPWTLVAALVDPDPAVRSVPLRPMRISGRGQRLVATGGRLGPSLGGRTDSALPAAARPDRFQHVLGGKRAGVLRLHPVASGLIAAAFPHHAKPHRSAPLSTPSKNRRAHPGVRAPSLGCGERDGGRGRGIGAGAPFLPRRFALDPGAGTRHPGRAGASPGDGPSRRISGPDSLPPHTIFPVMETLLRAKFDLEIFPIERSTDAFADRR